MPKPAAQSPDDLIRDHLSANVKIGRSAIVSGEALGLGDQVFDAAVKDWRRSGGGETWVRVSENRNPETLLYTSVTVRRVK